MEMMLDANSAFLNTGAPTRQDTSGMQEQKDKGGQDVCAPESNPIEGSKKHIGLKGVGMAGRCWMTKQISNKLKEREEVSRSEGIHTKAYKSLNEEVSRLTIEVKRGICQLKVLEMKGMIEMWRVLKRLTDNKPKNNICIITDNAKAYVCQSQKANVFMNMNKSVSSLKLTKEDRGVMRILNRTFQTLEITNGTWPGFTISEFRATLSNLNLSKAADPDEIHQRLLHHMGPKAVSFQQQLFNKSCKSTSVPQGCQVADIRPVQKYGKYRKKLDSYCQIFMTSTNRKVMECLVTNLPL